MAFRYDLEIDWHLLDTCNFRCGYCFFPPERLAAKLATFASVDEWRDAFDALGRTCLLHLTGGEPSIYPDFVALCAALTKNHYLSINTNLTHPSLIEFTQAIDPSRIAFINAGFHLEERERRPGHTTFLRHADLLHAKGFPIIISLVATPSVLARYEEVAEILRPTGLVVVPKLFRGWFAGKRYPESYTTVELDRFTQFCVAARSAYAPLFARNGEWPSIDMLHDDERNGSVPNFTGVSCEAGRRFVALDPRGNVFRCGKDRLGNILDRTFAPRLRPASCDTSYCYYFCTKYTLPNRTRAARTVDALIGTPHRVATIMQRVLLSDRLPLRNARRRLTLGSWRMSSISSSPTPPTRG